MDRRGGTREVVNLVDLYIEREGNVMAHHLEMRIAQQVYDVVAPASIEIVDAQDVAVAYQEALAEMRAKEACATRHHDPLTDHFLSSASRPRGPVLGPAPSCSAVLGVSQAIHLSNGATP